MTALDINTPLNKAYDKEKYIQDDRINIHYNGFGGALRRIEDMNKIEKTIKRLLIFQMKKLTSKNK